MRISDRLLRHYLDHVYWICGGPCGGKSTMMTMLSSKWGIRAYSVDDQTFAYQKKANSQDHPAILRHFVDWEWYFLGRGNDREQWLNSVFEESVEFTVLDLLQMGKNTPIVVDAFMEPEFLQGVSDNHHIVYLFAEDDVIRSEYLNRDHLRGMGDIFPKLSEPERARRATLENAVRASNHYLRQVQRHQVQYFVRDSLTTKEDMLVRIEQHFGLHQSLSMEDC